MTSRERVFAALEGRPVDRTPVTVLYATLYQEDHFGELTGRPPWQWSQWLNSDPGEYSRVFEEIHAEAPFEMVQPHGAPSPEERESVEFLEREPGDRPEAARQGRTRFDLARARDHDRPVYERDRVGLVFPL